MYLWLWLALASGVLLGVYDIMKKKAMDKIPLLNVLTLYTFCCFIFVSFELKSALLVDKMELVLIFVKSFTIYLSWILSFIAIRGLPISIVTPFGTLNPIFTVFLGVTILGERLQYLQIFGLAVIFTSYYLIGKVGSDEIKGLFKNKYLYLMAGGMLLSAISALIDKFALRSVNAGQIQFWFSLFLFLLYLITLIFWRTKNRDWTLFKFSWYIPLMSFFLVLSDRIYFEVVKMPESQISIILPLRKVSIFVSAIIGGLIFGEQNMKRKLACISLLMVGIVIIFVGK